MLNSGVTESSTLKLPLGIGYLNLQPWATMYSQTPIVNAGSKWTS